MTDHKLSATLSFTKDGDLKYILYHSRNNEDQRRLESSLGRHIKQRPLGWFQKFSGAMIRFIDQLILRFEKLIFKSSLHRREQKIQPQFDKRLSREIDCLQVLIESEDKHV